LENLHPEQFKRSNDVLDDDYEADEQEAISEGEGVLWEDTEVVEYSATVEPGRVVISDAPQAQAGPGDQWEDVPF
jgi:hypothetical protein